MESDAVRDNAASRDNSVVMRADSARVHALMQSDVICSDDQSRSQVPAGPRSSSPVTARDLANFRRGWRMSE